MTSPNALIGLKLDLRSLLRFICCFTQIFACDAVYRECWDDTDKVTSATEQQQPSQSSTFVIPHRVCQSSPQLCGSPVKHDSVHQVSSTSLPVSLPSSVSTGQADDLSSLLAQFRLLVESLPPQVATDLMKWFTQQLHTTCPPTVSLASQQVGTSAGDNAVSPRASTQNNSCELLPASLASDRAVSNETSCANAMALSADGAATEVSGGRQYVTSEMPPASVSSVLDQLNLLTQQLQQRYMESAASALHGLYCLQQQVVPSSSSTTMADSVQSQSAANLTRPD